VAVSRLQVSNCEKCITIIHNIGSKQPFNDDPETGNIYNLTCGHIKDLTTGL
jgi:hypothetical protein